MKRRKFLALLITVALLITQFSMLNIVSATSALTGRNDFAKGVNIHRAGFTAYRNTSKAIADAKALGSNYLRTNYSGNLSYDAGVVNAAAEEGMQTMFIMGLNVTDSNGSAISASNIDITAITELYSSYATALYGKVAYYQIGNEIDTVYKKSGNDGKYTSNYNDVSAAAVAIYAANNAIKSVDPSAKTVVNFSWYHYGFLEAVKAVKIDTRTGRVAASGVSSNYIAYADWDIVGLDWYASVDASATAYQGLISTVTSKFPSKDIIVCEANVKATNGSENGTITYNDTPSWLENFATYCYNNSKIKGFFVYELYDEPTYSYTNGSYSFNRESHFGLIDKNGNKKAMYNTVCALYGGTGVASSRSTPSMVEANDMFIVAEREICYGVYGADAVDDNWLPVWTTPTGNVEGSYYNFEEEVNFNYYDHIEFDYYVDNLTNLQARATSLKVGLMHYSGQTTRWADFRSYLTQNGWNHVKVPISAFNGASVTSERSTQVRFRTTMPASSVAANDVVAIANICATKEPEGPWSIAPDMQTSEGMLTVNEGSFKTGTLGASAVSSTLPGCDLNGSIKFFPETTDLTAYDYIEFDYYIENISNFNSRVSSFEITIYNASGLGTSYGDTTQFATAGWNHIKYPISSFNQSRLTTAIKVAFRPVLSAGSTGADDHYAVANVCATRGVWLITPAMPSSEEMLTVKEGSFKTGTLGSSTVSSMLPGTSSVAQSSASFSETTDLTAYDFIEFDYYIEDINNFNSRVSSFEITIYNASNQGTSYGDLSQFTTAGWNHITYPISSFNQDRIKTANRVAFRPVLSAGSTGADDHYTVANICATRGIWLIAPDMQISEGMLTVNEGSFKTGKLGSSAVSSTLPGYDLNGSVKFFPETTDLTAYDYIEFDYYIENISNFNSRVSSFEITIYNASGQGTSYGDTTQFMAAGWNHIKYPLSSFNQSRLTTAVKVAFRPVLNESSTGADDHYTVANISATLDPINIIPAINNIYTTMDSIPGTNHTMTLEAGENPYPSKGYFRLPKTLDTSNADYIEMDIYVSADTDSGGSTFWVSSDSEAAANRGRYELPELTAGWNHVVINASNTYRTFGSYTFKGYELSYPYFESLFFTSEHPTGGTVRVANLSVTCAIVVPTDIMEENISFNGGSVEFVTFDEDGMYGIEFEDAKDITDAKMIELDVLVSADAGNTVSIEIMDADGNYADYEFTGLVSGWNHLAVRISDFNPSEDNLDDVDLSDLSYFTVYGTANTDVVLANVYAADYVEGDANRDGLVDIKDVVRAKRLAAGATTEGNKLAVSGADYEINALDLTNLIQSVIDTLFN